VTLRATTTLPHGDTPTATTTHPTTGVYIANTHCSLTPIQLFHYDLGLLLWAVGMLPVWTRSLHAVAVPFDVAPS